MKVKIGDTTYDWDGEYTFQEGVAIEKQTGASFLDWLNRMNPATRTNGAQPSVTDIGVMLWVIARRTNPGLKFEDFDFPLDQWAILDDEGNPTTAAEDGASSSGDSTT